MIWKRYEALKWASSFLKSYKRDDNIGEILLCDRLGLTRTDLLANIREPLPDADAVWLKERVTEHALKGTPVQYMIGQAPFYGRRFKVTPDVLIPRPETEELVYRVGVWAGRFFGTGSRLSVCDIGTGSGAIAVTLALEHDGWQMTAVDVSAKALSVAEENAAALGAPVTFRLGSLLEPLEGRPFDVLVSNPPYVSRPEMRELSDTVKDYEPHLALFGGEDGLDFYRRILQALPSVFGHKPYFLLAFEIGASQGRAVESLVKQVFPDQIEDLAVEKDLSGRDRNVMAVIRIN